MLYVVYIRVDVIQSGDLLLYVLFFFFKQKTAYDIVSRDWSSDVCSSDLITTQSNYLLPILSSISFHLITFALNPEDKNHLDDAFSFIFALLYNTVI